MPNLKKTATLALAAGALVSVASDRADAQEPSVFGETYDYAAPTFIDLTIPDLRGSIIRFDALGADGGDAEVGRNNSCFNSGGEGAWARIDCVIGDGEFELTPGDFVRFVVGEAGQDNINRGPNRGAAAGGGGGTGVLYFEAGSNTRNILAVGGGGGGAYTGIALGICTNLDQNGRAASTGECGVGGNSSGGDPATGGCNGGSGVGVTGISGGGGGVFGLAPGIGGEPGLNTGGAGGTGGIRRGGFGYGGGGGSVRGAGGGGGYSGGGGGRTTRAGGGGGSYVHPDFAQSDAPITSGTPTTNGRIAYAFTGQVHDERADKLDIGDRTVIRGTAAGATESVVGGCPSTGELDV